LHAPLIAPMIAAVVSASLPPMTASISAREILRDSQEAVRRGGHRLRQQLLRQQLLRPADVVRCAPVADERDRLWRRVAGSSVPAAARATMKVTAWAPAAAAGWR
jgi:hypothetical protein